MINIWSSRGLSIYGEVTLIKTLLIPKVVYACSLSPTPKYRYRYRYLIYKYLWKGKDKVIRVSAMNNHEEGGIKVIDTESLMKSL